MTSSFEQKDAVQRVKDAAQIIDIIGETVSLKRAGANMKGLCPFHAEKTPSFMVNPARQSFHCFGCGEGGDVFTFMMKYYNLTFPETLKQLGPSVTRLLFRKNNFLPKTRPGLKSGRSFLMPTNGRPGCIMNICCIMLVAKRRSTT
jgi:DNA primase